MKCSVYLFVSYFTPGKENTFPSYERLFLGLFMDAYVSEHGNKTNPRGNVGGRAVVFDVML